MRARYPDHEGFVDRDGVKVAFEVYGCDGPAVLFVPASPISHARSWKGMIPFLSRHMTVIATDGRGTHHSDRPHRRERYGPDEVDADLVAVLEAAGVTEAVVVAHCHADAVGDAARRRARRTSSPVSCSSRPPWRWRRGTTMRRRRSGVGRTASSSAEAWSMRNRAFWRTDGGYRALGRVLLRAATA